MNGAQAFHGSDIEKIEKSTGINKEEFINFSANVNPLGISPSIFQYLPSKIGLIATYPDRDYSSLRETISNYIHVPSEFIIVGNGSTELISLCIQTMAPRKTVIIGPTYSEYERELRLQGGECVYYPLLEEADFILDHDGLVDALGTDVDFLVICNPNNPTSSYIPTPVLEKIMSHCSQNNIFVMIDETYIEFVAAVDSASSVHLYGKYQNFLTIRGVSKFFAAPGLRLGYAVCSNATFLSKLNAKKNPWSVNSLSAFAGELMLQDTQYIQDTKNLIQSEREKMFQSLRQNPFLRAFNPSANFILVKILPSTNGQLTASSVFDTLIKKKLVIRDATSFQLLHGEFIRFCIMLPEHNQMLLEALGELLPSND